MENSYLRQRGNKVSFLLMLALFILPALSLAQDSPTIFARVVFQKVPTGKESEYEKYVREIMKPVNDLRKRKGKIVDWIFFKVHFAGANDEYNYVSIHYYGSWAATEANDSWPALIKEAHPKVDAAALVTKASELRSVVREHLYFRADVVNPKTPSVPKFVMIDYMKVRPGKQEEYMKVEQEWKPFHQHLADNGKAAGWSLWSLVLPGGSASTHDFATGNLYSSYDQIGGVDYAATFKTVYPSRDPQAEFDKADQARDRVRSELWEAIVTLN